ncbi:MAG: DUF222 domain-containing protein, partial [Nocardioides sp.]
MTDEFTPHVALHPIVVAAGEVAEVLKGVESVNPVFMSTPDKAEALQALARVEGQLVELRLRVLATADDVAAETASRDVGSWLAWHTRTRIEDARADQALADAVDRRYAHLGAALREGIANPAQAVVIARGLDALPAETGPEIRDLAETTLIGYCADHGPRTLARLAARILHHIAPDVADEAEARRLAALEADAARSTRLTLRRLG